MKFPTYEEMARDVAEKALDEYEYKGKTLRQWIEIIRATDINAATKDGTNLAEVGTDCISRQQAINALSTITLYKGSIPFNTAVMRIEQLPSAQPDIIYCGECTKMKVDSVFHDCRCSETGKKVWINHYCGYAERREQ